jgi:hypothetical protein
LEPDPARSTRFTLTAWTALALANLAAGAVVSSWSDRQLDLRRVAHWARLWLDGVNVYGAPAEFVDYPPHAIVVLSPLALVADGALVPLWAAFNILLSGAAVYLTVRGGCQAVNREFTIHCLTRPALALPMLMFVCWGGFRAQLQFSLLTLTGGLAAIVWADRRPLWSAAALAIALAKPQIAAPFVLWMLFSRRWRHAAAALAVVVLLFGVYCAVAGVSPVQVAADYVSIVRTLYTGDDPMQGLGQLRPLLAAIAAPEAADAIAFGISSILLAGIVWLGIAEGPRPKDMSAALLLAPAWSLLTFYHLTYGFLLLLPTAATLLSVDDAATRSFRRRLFWAMQAGLMFDVATVSSWAGPALGAPAAVETIAAHVDRLLMLALSAALAMLAVRSRRRPLEA